MKSAALFVVVVLAVPVAGLAQDGPVVIKAETVLDGKGGTLSNTGIVVQGSKITKIDPNAQAATYDLHGLTVMPGWIDTHAHIVEHFDRKTGKTPRRGDETPQQQALYAAENAHDAARRLHHGAEPG
jgi:imidazolonepropionase-like amidohydrolase